MPSSTSPRNVALIIAISVGIVVGVGQFILTHFHFNNSIGALFSVVFTSVITFAIASVSINYFLNEKLHLIFKSISTHRNSAQHLKTLDYSKNVLSNVSMQVENYQQRINTEIATLQTNASYRQEFLGNVSHELRTPLFVLQGYLLTLIDGGIDDKEIHLNYLKRAQRNVERLINLVDDLQVITQLEHETAELVTQKENLTALVTDVIHGLELEAQQLNVTLTCTEKKAVYVLCNKQKIEQVLVNLIMNAIKYSKAEGGTIAIKMYDIDTKIIIEVADNGIGIAENHLRRVFERFYRVDTHRARAQGGSGLGLAIVKHSIEAHHQNISVRSTVGQGTTFSFTLNKA